MNRWVVSALFAIAACVPSKPGMEYGILREGRTLADGSEVVRIEIPEFAAAGNLLSRRQTYCRRRAVDITPSVREGDWVEYEVAQCHAYIADFDHEAERQEPALVLRSPADRDVR